jgi:predicted NUDIX family phosphoesterase
MTNAYLDIAERTIRETGRPLHPKEMLKIASDSELIPQHLSGKTQYKTLAARLSTEIRTNEKKSPFLRTAANRFFLRDLMTPNHQEYQAPKRQKTLHNESVLTVSDAFLREASAIGIFSNVPQFLQAISESDYLRYVVRKSAEKRFDIKQIISYALVFRRDHILTYRRGIFNNAADELQGKRSIGFGGHVTDEDLNLFDSAGLGIVENARRELCEELVFDGREQRHLDLPTSFSFLCGLNSYETIEARKHIAISLVYFCSNDFVPAKNEMSVNDLRWTCLNEQENNLDDFEPWSQDILQALYSGRRLIPFSPGAPHVDAAQNLTLVA